MSNPMPQTEHNVCWEKLCMLMGFSYEWKPFSRPWYGISGRPWTHHGRRPEAHLVKCGTTKGLDGIFAVRPPEKPLAARKSDFSPARQLIQFDVLIWTTYDRPSDEGFSFFIVIRLLHTRSKCITIKREGSFGLSSVSWLMDSN